MKVRYAVADRQKGVKRETEESIKKWWAGEDTCAIQDSYAALLLCHRKNEPERDEPFLEEEFKICPLQNLFSVDFIYWLKNSYKT